MSSQRDSPEICDRGNSGRVEIILEKLSSKLLVGEFNKGCGEGRPQVIMGRVSSN